MLSRFLEKRVEVELENNSQLRPDYIELEYYLLESMNPELEEIEIQKTYGIEIVKKHSGIPEEYKKYVNIYCNRNKIKSLVDLLAENTVTPATLPDILDDLLGI